MIMTKHAEAAGAVSARRYRAKIIYENALEPPSSLKKQNKVIIPLENPCLYKAAGRLVHPHSWASGKAVLKSLSIGNTYLSFRDFGLTDADCDKFEIEFGDIVLDQTMQGTLYIQGKWTECNAIGRAITVDSAYTMYGRRGHRTILGSKELRITPFLDIEGDVSLYFIRGNKTGKVIDRREEYCFEDGDAAYIGFCDGLGDYALTLYFRNETDKYACTLNLSTRDYYDLFCFEIVVS